MKTPNVQRIVDSVEQEFGDRVSTGEWLCRHIAGTTKWSQHSWTENPETGIIYQGNAADIFPDNMAVGDQVQAYIKRNFDTVAHLLWRVKNHFDHVHVDTWPQGYGLPPCRGGTLRVQYADGSIGRTFYQEEDLPLNDDDKAWITKTIHEQVVMVLGGDRITMPKIVTTEGDRYGNQGIVNSVWHATTGGKKTVTVLDQTSEEVWAETPGGAAAGSTWQNLLRAKTNTDKIIDELT